MEPYSGAIHAGSTGAGPSGRSKEPEDKTGGVADEALKNTSWKTLGLQFAISAGLMGTAVTIAAVVIALTTPYFLSIMASGGATAIAGPILLGAGTALVCGMIASPLLFFD